MATEPDVPSQLHLGIAEIGYSSAPIFNGIGWLWGRSLASPRSGVRSERGASRKKPWPEDIAWRRWARPSTPTGFKPAAGRQGHRSWTPSPVAAGRLGQVGPLPQGREARRPVPPGSWPLLP